MSGFQCSGVGKRCEGRAVGLKPSPFSQQPGLQRSFSPLDSGVTFSEFCETEGLEIPLGLSALIDNTVACVQNVKGDHELIYVPRFLTVVLLSMSS